MRQALDEAIDYSANLAAANGGNRRSYSLSYSDLSALGSVVRGAKPLLVRVSRASDISRVLLLAEDYQLKLILADAQEAWKVADSIAAANVPVIMDPIHNLPVSYETLASRLDNAKLLNDAGVMLLFTGMSWHNTHNAYLVRQSAGNAVANGLPKPVAIAAMTTNPAKVFGINGYGDIAVGSSATLVLWDGDPLDVMSYPQLVLIEGDTVENRSRQLELRDRYFEKLQ